MLDLTGISGFLNSPLEMPHVEDVMMYPGKPYRSQPEDLELYRGFDVREVEYWPVDFYSRAESAPDLRILIGFPVAFETGELLDMPAIRTMNSCFDSLMNDVMGKDEDVDFEPETDFSLKVRDLIDYALDSIIEGELIPFEAVFWTELNVFADET